MKYQLSSAKRPAAPVAQKPFDFAAAQEALSESLDSAHAAYQQLVAAEGRATQITSGAFIRRHHLKSASSVQAASKKLLEYHLLSTEKGAYYIDDQLMRLWLLQ